LDLAPLAAIILEETRETRETMEVASLQLPSPPDPAAATPLSEGVAVALLVELAEAVVISDPEGRIVFWNAACERLFGWAAADVLDRPLDVIIPAKHRARHWDGYRAVMASGSTKYSTQLLEVPALHRDGRRLSISFTVTLVRAAGAVVGIAAVVRDETERWEEKRRLLRQVAILDHQARELPL
jgi:PAS domain S-box-containing protein